MDGDFFTDEALDNLSENQVRELIALYNKPLLFKGPFESDGETVTLRKMTGE